MNIVISNVSIKKIPEQKGHVGFVSCVLNECIKLNNIAIFKRLDAPGYRLVFPEKKIGDSKIQLFFPLTADAYFLLEKELTKWF